MFLSLGPFFLEAFLSVPSSPPTQPSTCCSSLISKTIPSLHLPFTAVPTSPVASIPAGLVRGKGLLMETVPPSFNQLSSQRFQRPP